jgi:hypothetical protein
MANDFTGAEVFEVVGMNYGTFVAEGTGEAIPRAPISLPSRVAPSIISPMVTST